MGAPGAHPQPTWDRVYKAVAQPRAALCAPVLPPACGKQPVPPERTGMCVEFMNMCGNIKIIHFVGQIWRGVFDIKMFIC